jgi:hypothetical protein
VQQDGPALFLEVYQHVLIALQLLPKVAGYQ